MPSVIKLNGKMYTASRGYRPGLVAQDGRPQANNLRKDGALCDGTPIPPGSPDSPFRDGTPYEDQREGVVYRIVHNLNISEGWGTAEFWVKRWGCLYADLLHFAQLGWLDAAISYGSAVKRFRCRDEHRVLRWLGVRALLNFHKRALMVSPRDLRRRQAVANAKRIAAQQVRRTNTRRRV